jgi:glyoxylase-like metal-dependent hydrolase (beta-lactamase superfamily II)
MSRAANAAPQTPADLERLGIKRIETPTPFPQVPTANAWLLEVDELTVIDTGTTFRPAWEAFQARIAELGHEVADIRRVLITHGHPDHAGLARTIQKRSGARVYVHEADARKITEIPAATARWAQERYDAYYRILGMPDAFIDYMHQIADTALRVQKPVESVEILHDGDRFDLGRFSLEVVSCPGHTPGCVCFLLPEHRVLFSGDHLLPKISPNPVLELGVEGGEEHPWEGKFRSLVHYIESLARTRAMDVATVLPGHDDPIADHRRLIDQLNRFHTIRSHKIVQAMLGGEATVYELTRQLFPDRHRMELFLSLSEVVGHLEVLEEEGRIERAYEDGRLYFRVLDTDPADGAKPREEESFS